MFSGFLRHFVTSFGNVLAGAFDGVAGRQDCGCTAENGEKNERNCQFASHGETLDDGKYRL